MMCDAEERREENLMIHRTGHRSPTLECEQCNKLMPRQSIVQDWKDTGWDICEFCIDSVPDFVAEYVEELESRLMFAERERHYDDS